MHKSVRLLTRWFWNLTLDFQIYYILFLKKKKSTQDNWNNFFLINVSSSHTLKIVLLRLILPKKSNLDHCLNLIFSILLNKTELYCLIARHFHIRKQVNLISHYYWFSSTASTTSTSCNFDFFFNIFMFTEHASQSLSQPEEDWDHPACS